MNRPLLKTKPTRWNIETSQKVKAPEFFLCCGLQELFREVQDLANTYIPRPNSPALGILSFHTETDSRGRTVVVRAYFRDRHGKQARFMRLRRA